jgi:hypothetical protein
MLPFYSPFFSGLYNTGVKLEFGGALPRRRYVVCEGAAQPYLLALPVLLSGFGELTPWHGFRPGAKLSRVRRAQGGERPVWNNNRRKNYVENRF